MNMTVDKLRRVIELADSLDDAINELYPASTSEERRIIDDSRDSVRWMKTKFEGRLSDFERAAAKSIGWQPSDLTFKTTR